MQENQKKDVTRILGRNLGKVITAQEISNVSGGVWLETRGIVTSESTPTGYGDSACWRRPKIDPLIGVMPIQN